MGRQGPSAMDEKQARLAAQQLARQPELTAVLQPAGYLKEGQKYDFNAMKRTEEVDEALESSFGKGTLEEIEAAFKKFDTNGDGFLDKQEVKAILQRPGGGNALTDKEA